MQGIWNWWTWSGSNRRPLPCHGSALPAAPQAHIQRKELPYSFSCMRGDASNSRSIGDLCASYNWLHRMTLENHRFFIVPRLLAFLAVLLAGAMSQVAPGSLDVHWQEGASNCTPGSQSPIQVHPYNDRTYILRESLCATFEGPFLYLLIGTKKALLIDTGDVADPKQMP